MTNPTPPYIERFREKFLYPDGEGGYQMGALREDDPETIEKFWAREIKQREEKAKQEGAEEKMRECLNKIVEFRNETQKRGYKHGAIAITELIMFLRGEKQKVDPPPRNS